MAKRTPSTSASPFIAIERISQVIQVVRSQRVILDRDLALLYGVTTKRMNEAVKRNIARFPVDFMFRLTATETEIFNRSQIATGSEKHRDPRYPPFAFTEHGAIQVANILKSPRAVEMGVYVVRAFIQLREFLASNKRLELKLVSLERSLGELDAKTQGQLREFYALIRQLMSPPASKRRGIGFTADL